MYGWSRKIWNNLKLTVISSFLNFDPNSSFGHEWSWTRIGDQLVDGLAARHYLVARHQSCDRRLHLEQIKIIIIRDKKITNSNQ